MSEAPYVGATIDGRYRIRAVLGKGGMGTVYAAEQIAPCREVAIKILHPELALHGPARRRFKREARATTRIRHPNVVEVFDLGVDDRLRVPYIVYRRLRGKSLADHLTIGSRLTEATAAAIAIPLGEALSEAHRVSLIHRDVKAANVILEEDGEGLCPRLVDFGLSRAIEAGVGVESWSRLTATGSVVGSPHSMAPEQIEGRADLDSRCDVWALAALVYRMVEGRHAFEATTPTKVMHKIRSQAARAPGPHVSSALRRLLMGGLARHPDDRPETMERFVSELRRAVPRVASPLRLNARVGGSVPVEEPTQDAAGSR